MATMAVARAVFTPAESDAFARQKEAQAALRRDEKKIVREAHSKTGLMTKSVKDLRVRASMGPTPSPPAK